MESSPEATSAIPETASPPPHLPPPPSQPGKPEELEAKPEGEEAAAPAALSMIGDILKEEEEEEAVVVVPPPAQPSPPAAAAVLQQQPVAQSVSPVESVPARPMEFRHQSGRFLKQQVAEQQVFAEDDHFAAKALETQKKSGEAHSVVQLEKMMFEMKLGQEEDEQSSVFYQRATPPAFAVSNQRLQTAAAMLPPPQQHYLPPPSYAPAAPPLYSHSHSRPPAAFPQQPQQQPLRPLHQHHHHHQPYYRGYRQPVRGAPAPPFRPQPQSQRYLLQPQVAFQPQIRAPEPLYTPVAAPLQAAGGSWSETRNVVPGLTSNPSTGGTQDLFSSGSHYLQELRQKLSNEGLVTLEDMEGHFCEVARDQEGSRILQNLIEKSVESGIEPILTEIVEESVSIAEHKFGNYVIQKLLERCSPVQRQQLADQLLGSIGQFSKNLYGCRVVQKALQLVTEAQLKIFLGQIRQVLGELIEDHNGNHVVQLCLTALPVEAVDFILEELEVNLLHYCKHQYGCRVIQSFFTRGFPSSARIIAKMVASLVELAQNQFGNYVIQNLLEKSKTPGVNQQAFLAVIENIVSLSKHSFGSHVIEKVLEEGDPSQRYALVESVIGSTRTHPSELKTTLFEIVCDKFGNYVVQKVLDYCDTPQRDFIVERLQAVSERIRHQQNYSRHVYSFIENGFKNVPQPKQKNARNQKPATYHHSQQQQHHTPHHTHHTHHTHHHHPPPAHYPPTQQQQQQPIYTTAAPAYRPYPTQQQQYYAPPPKRQPAYRPPGYYPRPRAAPYPYQQQQHQYPPRGRF